MNDTADKLRSLSFERGGEPASGGGGVGLPALAISSVVALVIGAAAGWVLKPAPEPAPAASTPSAAQPVAPAVTPGGLVASGFVVARRRATVAAEVTGRVLEVRVEEGQTVRAGEVLAVLDATLVRAELASAAARADAAQSEIAAVRADLGEARLQLQRTVALSEREFASDAALKSAQARVSTLEARLAQAEAQRAASQRDAQRAQAVVARYEIKAPFAGVVVDKAAQPGEIISPVSAGGGFTRTGICTIVDMESLEIEVDVNESFIARVRPGQKVEAVLDAFPDVTFPATVIAPVPTANRDRATVRVRVGFDQLDPRILPDMAIKVTFLES